MRFFVSMLLGLICVRLAADPAGEEMKPWRAAPLVDPEDRMREIRRLEALPMSTVEANSATGSTLGDEIDTLATACNMSYISLPDGALKDTAVTFHIYDNPWGVLKQLSLAYSFDMTYVQVSKGRSLWQFTPIRPDELITRVYVLKNKTHEVTTAGMSGGSLGAGGSGTMGAPNGTGNMSSGGGSMGGQNGGGGTGFNSDNPLTAQLRDFLQVSDKGGGPQGFVRWIPDENAFWVKATAKQHEDIENFLAEVDKPIPEMTLEFAFVLASVAPSEHTGIDSSLFDGIPLNLSGLSTNIDLNHPKNTLAPSSAMLSTSDLNLTLNFFRSHHNSYSVITGSQTVLSNRDADLDSVQELPIQQNSLAPVGNGATAGVTTGTIDFKDVGTIVQARAKAMEGHKIQLTLNIQVSSVVDFMDVGGQKVPVTAKQKYNTTVIVEEGMSLAMGGLESSVNTETMKKFPILGDLPYFGFPFRSIAKDITHTRLLLFVTPKILEGYKGGNFAGTQRVSPVTSTPRVPFDARPGRSIADVEAALVHFNDDIVPLEVSVRAGRGDSEVKRQARVLNNELDLMAVTMDENKVRGLDNSEVRERIKLYHTRLDQVIKDAKLEAL